MCIRPLVRDGRRTQQGRIEVRQATASVVKKSKGKFRLARERSDHLYRFNLPVGISENESRLLTGKRVRDAENECSKNEKRRTDSSKHEVVFMQAIAAARNQKIR